MLLKYADQSAEGNVTKLEVAKLIVKYLPIFMNGDMEQPISEGVFYELAELGDTSGIPLSRKIVDTAKTTRMLDDEVIAAMLSDDQVSDIIKRVFAHAKFGKTKTQTVPPRHEPDGFQTEIAKKGRDEGYRLGMQDYEKYVDYDDVSVQAAFESAIADYITELHPKNLKTEEQVVWWSNGFTKGYESGVNAPIKKMKCGKDDGIQFVAEIKKHFGSGTVWKEETKRPILDFIHKHLNNKENIPQEYRGALYYRWYCESFRQAIKAELSPKIPYEKGNSVEDADNVMRHILARLFEFLYISVYRETTFQEIFANADPNVFLEAVGITKKDFEILNKYHVFQETILNNYIHQFFVNESLGTKLNLEDEEVKKQYRNSFDWFGFGLEGEITEQNNEQFLEEVRAYAEEMTQKPNSMSIVAQESIAEAVPAPNAHARYYLAYGSNLNLNQMAMRCPTARRVGHATLAGYRLMFKRSTNGYYLTVEPAPGYKVPVGVFQVEESDELSLDRYAGYPNVYYKKNFTVILEDDEFEDPIEAFAYILPESRELGTPEKLYVQRVKQGYREFGFDEDLINEALEYSREPGETIEEPSPETISAQRPEKISLKDQIVSLLKRSKKGLKSGQMADKLGVSKKDVNRVLYSDKKLFTMNILFVWSIRK